MTGVECASDGIDSGPLAARILALPRPLLLAWDVDGTLAPIVDDPAQARVSEGLLENLRSLSDVPGICLALITGRDSNALAAMLSLPAAYLAVEHGAVILAPGEHSEISAVADQDRKKLTAFELWAKERAVKDGAELEVKRSSRGLHVRRLKQRNPELAADLLNEAESVANALGLTARRGRAVLEAELYRGDKGAALQDIATLSGARGVCFAGDDLTDGPAIECAVALGGVGLFVRSVERPRGPALASATLNGCADVQRLVSVLAELALHSG